MARPRKQISEDGMVDIVLHKLHAGQEKIDADDHRFQVVMCGRRFGKTVFGIRRLCDSSLAGNPCAWFAPGYKYALEAWREFVQRLGPIASRISEQERRIDLITGGSIEVWTLDTQDPARGRKYKDVVIDEAGIVKDLMQTWQAAIRPTLVDLGGRALILGTPKGRRHGFILLFNRGNDPEEKDWQSYRAPTLDNPHIPPEEVELARQELPPGVFAQEFEGIPYDDGANPFGIQKIKAAAKSEEDLAKACGPIVVWGIDLARSIDFTVAVGLDAHMRVAKLERWQAPWVTTKERILALIGDTPAVVDASGSGDGIVSDLQQQGNNASITGFVFTQPSKLRLMQRLIAVFQNEDAEIPDEQWLISELESFEFNYTANGIKYEAPSGLHDDGVMALGLAIYGWDRVQGAKPETNLPLQRVGDDPHIVGRIGPAAIAEPGDFLQQLPSGGW